jgi:dipeptide/tripeptide permease
VLLEAFRGTQIERERLFVVLILTVFSLLFWAFFEQAGSSMANFIDRNIDRVFEARRLATADVGTQITFRISAETNDAKLEELPLLTQEQLGRENGDATMGQEIANAMRMLNDGKSAEQKLAPEKLADFVKVVTSTKSLTFTGLTNLREAAMLRSSPIQTLKWTVVPDDVGMGIGGSEIPASMFQAANPIFILLFGLVFTALWAFLAVRGWEPSTPVKFGLALVQLALGFVALWYGAQYAGDGRGMVSMSWLLVAILMHTTGELSQSPIGLSMVTKLSPKHLVSTVMGAWFVGLGLANSLAGWIAQFTGIGDDGAGGPQVIPLPKDTLHIYGKVFGQIAVAAFITAAVCLALSPILKRWMHSEADQQ